MGTTVVGSRRVKEEEAKSPVFVQLFSAGRMNCGPRRKTPRQFRPARQEVMVIVQGIEYHGCFVQGSISTQRLFSWASTEYSAVLQINCAFERLNIYDLLLSIIPKTGKNEKATVPAFTTS